MSADRCFLEERQGVAVAVASAAATEVDDLSFASESATLMLGVRYVALLMQMRWSEAGGLASAQDETRVRADAERRRLEARDDAEAGCASGCPSFGRGNGTPPNRGPDAGEQELALLLDAPECGLDSDI